jgi:hypothetical protein
VIITPHVSGDFVGYFDAAADLLVANVENVRKGGKAYNVVDPKKGYWVGREGGREELREDGRTRWVECDKGEARKQSDVQVAGSQI